MSNVKYTLINNEAGKSLIVWTDTTVPLTVPGDHPRFQDILNGALNDDASVIDLVDLSVEVVRQFERLSDNIALIDGIVCYSGDPIDNTLSNLIIRHLDDGVSDWSPLVLFLEKLYTNLDAGVRENLFRWISDRDLTITDNGNILGYKGLRYDYTSVHAGPGIVNDVPTDGNLDNSVGNVLEMARSEVTNDPSIACSTGLHVGSRDYAESFGSVVVVVEVDPQHVVSVPYDCNGEKMRVSKYVVLEDVADSYGAVYKKASHDEHVHFAVGGSVSSVNISANAIAANTITFGTVNSNQAPKRDAQGRFVKGGGTNKRDAQGRFIKS